MLLTLKNLFNPTRRSNASHKTNSLPFYSLLNQTLNFRNNWRLFCVLQSARKSKPMVHKLAVTLEELYNGKLRKLAANRDIRCDDCDGKGGSVVKKCPDCRGQGIKTVTKQIGPGMIQQMQAPCSACETRGEIVDPSNKCKSCKGKRTKRDKKILEVQIDKGMPSNHRFTFYGEGDHEPGKEPGDVIIQLEEKPHSLFNRHGKDISVRKDINLHEALCGLKFPIKSLGKLKYPTNTFDLSQK